ncbi:non-catalytic module family expn protein [Moniliophthora roreri]|uniref:Uncharacterized protein n=1 Tax=Moniliophthora roreri TaxID=221103 RepID=A0A0W0EX39_MONRR|nr:non-catalytic module family expn protein [Moniliophthora roreri]
MAFKTSTLFSLFSILVCLGSISVIAAPVFSPKPELERRGSMSGILVAVFGLGNCGWQSVDTDWIVALPTSAYGNGEHCGKKVVITDDSNNRGTAIVVDSCPSCPGTGDLDMSPSLFSFFKPQSDGTFKITWWFADENGN